MKSRFILLSILALIIFAFAITYDNFAQTPMYYNYQINENINSYPFGVPNGTEINLLYPPGNFGNPSPAPSCWIGKIYFYMGNTDSVTLTNLCIRMLDTTLISLPGGAFVNVTDTVYFAQSVNLVSTSGQWMGIQLQKLFYYDNTKSLIVDISQCSSTSNMSVYQHTYSSNVRDFQFPGNCTHTYYGQDNQACNLGFDISSQTIPRFYNYAINERQNYYPFGVVEGEEVNWLYLPGNFNNPSPAPSCWISKLYFYMGYFNGNATLTELCIRMLDTTLTSLPSGNFIRPIDTVYFAASVNLTSTIGQWMGIQLQKPFYYDNTKSLLVDISQCSATNNSILVCQHKYSSISRNLQFPGNCIHTYWGHDSAAANMGFDTISTQPSTICQGFEASSFPPLGWTISGVAPSYLTRMSSGYYSAHSVRYRSYILPAGWFENLTTPTFITPSLLGDSIGFAYSYCHTWINPDRLLIQASSDNGTSFITLDTMNQTELTTSTNCGGNYEYTPSSNSEWSYKYIALPAGTNKLNFQFISGDGNDIWIDSICVKSVFIGIKPIIKQLPTIYSLSQNYPNPFNPITKIKYQIAKSGDVKIIIYDITGKEVDILVNEKQSPGVYEVDFNGVNYASGVYFYKLETETFTETKKMVLVK